MAVPVGGIKNRNLARGETFYYREICVYINNSNTTAPQPTGAVARFNFPEAMEIIEAQASADVISGGITTYTVDVLNSSASMLSSTISLKSHAQEVVVGTLSSSNTRLAAREVGRILVTNSNNENVYRVFIKVTFRPLVGNETRL